MTDNVIEKNGIEIKLSPDGDLAANLGESFLHALAGQDFGSLEQLFQPEVRFRAVVPSGERLGSSAGEAAGWFRRWFTSSDAIQVLHSSVGLVFDRLYVSYQFRINKPVDGWEVIEQHAYCTVQNDRIADMWLICSGFRPDQDSSQAAVAADGQGIQPHLGGDLFYNAGSKGCAEGPIEEINRLLHTLSRGQTLEIYATDPSVAGDLPALCRLSGHTLVKSEGPYYLIQHQ